MNTDTQLDTKKKQPLTIQSLLAGPALRAELDKALAKHLDPERFIRIATSMVSRTPKLKDCTPTSLFNCLVNLSALGLEPDGRHAHLIPYGQECTLIVDYKGLVALVRRSGEVSNIHADVICKNDRFEFTHGSGAKLIHQPNFQDRGEVIGAYSYVLFKDESESFDVMNKGEIDAVRAKSRSGKSGPWADHYNEMAKKTVFRRHTKWLPLSYELQEQIHREDGPTMDIQSEVISSEEPEKSTPKRNGTAALKDAVKSNVVQMPEHAAPVETVLVREEGDLTPEEEAEMLAATAAE